MKELVNSTVKAAVKSAILLLAGGFLFGCTAIYFDLSKGGRTKCIGYYVSGSEDQPQSFVAYRHSNPIESKPLPLTFMVTKKFERKNIVTESDVPVGYENAIKVDIADHGAFEFCFHTHYAQKVPVRVEVRDEKELKQEQDTGETPSDEIDDEKKEKLKAKEEKNDRKKLRKEAKEKEIALRAQVKPIKNRIDNLEKTLGNIGESAQYFLDREARMFVTSETIHNRIKWLKVIIIFGFIASVACQMHLLRRFFVKEKLV